MEKETARINILKEINPSNENWMQDGFVKQILLPNNPDKKFYRGDVINIDDKNINLLIYGNSLEGCQLNNVIDQKFIDEIKITLKTFAEKSPQKLKYLDNLIYSQYQHINENNKKPINAINLSNRFSLNIDDPELSSYKTIIIFPNILNLGPYRNEIKEVNHIQGVIAHELSHNFGTAPLEYTKIFQKEGGITSYGNIHKDEDFAEAIALYIMAPNRLKQISNDKFNYIKNLFNSYKK